jgi:pyruvate kinase
VPPVTPPPTQTAENAPRKTKVVCTLGPSCWSEEGLGALIDAGMNVARFNFSHGDHEGHLEVLERLRKVRVCLWHWLAWSYRVV